MVKGKIDRITSVRESDGLIKAWEPNDRKALLGHLESSLGYQGIKWDIGEQ